MAKKAAAKKKTETKKKTEKKTEVTAIKIHCKFDKMIGIDHLRDHPKNPNKHGSDQIERLSRLYKSHGVRHPIIVSNRSGFVVVGHGRKLAAIRSGMKEFPVVYQDFINEEQEYAFMTADNGIAEWASLDLAKINSELANLGPDFDLDDLGIKNFVMDMADKEFDPDGEDEKPDKKHRVCPHCGEAL